MFSFTSHVLLSLKNYKCITAVFLDFLSRFFVLVTIGDYTNLQGMDVSIMH